MPTTGHAARTRRAVSAGSRPVALAVAAAAVLVAFHLPALHQGPGWASPLLIGDHLFDLGFAPTLLVALRPAATPPARAACVSSLSARLLWARSAVGPGGVRLGWATFPDVDSRAVGCTGSVL